MCTKYLESGPRIPTFLFEGIVEGAVLVSMILKTYLTRLGEKQAIVWNPPSIESLPESRDDRKFAYRVLLVRLDGNGGGRYTGSLCCDFIARGNRMGRRC